MLGFEPLSTQPLSTLDDEGPTFPLGGFVVRLPAVVTVAALDGQDVPRVALLPATSSRVVALEAQDPRVIGLPARATITVLPALEE